MKDISISISTYNRPDLLASLLASLNYMDSANLDYEIIIVDNGLSQTDKIKLKLIVQGLSLISGRIKIVEEKKTGLHFARHCGAYHANSEIICYLDDDVTVSKTWLRSIWETFCGTAAVLVGGKILPDYEEAPPLWINEFWRETNEGKCLGILALIDYGDKMKEIDPVYVWGCNFSIRKKILLECGGFHPDSFPEKLLRFRGDGETFLSNKIKEKGYKAFYHPNAVVYHRIPKSRMTVEYFCKRMFNQGISDSFSEIRKLNGIKNPVLLQIRDAYKKGIIFHREEVLKDSKLLEWILRENFLNTEDLIEKEAFEKINMKTRQTIKRKRK